MTTSFGNWNLTLRNVTQYRALRFRFVAIMPKGNNLNFQQWLILCMTSLYQLWSTENRLKTELRNSTNNWAFITVLIFVTILCLARERNHKIPRQGFGHIMWRRVVYHIYLMTYIYCSPISFNQLIVPAQGIQRSSGIHDMSQDSDLSAWTHWPSANKMGTRFWCNA